MLIVRLFTTIASGDERAIQSYLSTFFALRASLAIGLYDRIEKNNMVGLPAISNSLQEIATFGIKEHVRETRRYGDWFHLLLFLASQGWNISIEGEGEILPTIPKEFNKRRKELGIKKKEIEANFITTDLIEITRRFAEIKDKEYPFDRRFIHAIELTREGNLRVYSA